MSSKSFPCVHSSLHSDCAIRRFASSHPERRIHISAIRCLAPCQQNSSLSHTRHPCITNLDLLQPSRRSHPAARKSPTCRKILALFKSDSLPSVLLLARSLLHNPDIPHLTSVILKTSLLFLNRVLSKVQSPPSCLSTS